MKKLLFLLLSVRCIYAQDLEVAGQMKVKDLPSDNSAQELVVKQSDGTLAQRSLASLIGNSNGEDSLNSFWRDIAVIQTLCGCENFDNINSDLIKRLLSHGYTREELTSTGNAAYFNHVNTVDDLDSVRDGDGNWYHPIVVTNGTKSFIFLKEPMISTTYIDGSPIAFAESNAAWAAAGTNETGAYCWPNGSIANEAYGALYNQYAIAEKEMCPYGYKSASPSDLNSRVGSFGLGVKEIGTSYWDNFNVSSNSSRLSLKGAGSRNPDGTYFGFRELSYITNPTSTSGANVTYPSNADYYGFQGMTLSSVSFGWAQLQESYYIYSNQYGHPTTFRPRSLGFTVRCRKVD